MYILNINKKMENAIINFTYKSPSQDIENCCGFNADGTINVKYTLATLRNLLLKNAEIIKKIMDRSIHITNIDIIDFNCIQIAINNKDNMENLFNEKILLRPEDLDNDDTSSMDSETDFIFSDSEKETNHDRYKMINNMVNSNNIPIIDNNSDTDSESSDDIIDDKHNTRLVLNKYSKMIKNYKLDSDDEDHSD